MHKDSRVYLPAYVAILLVTNKNVTKWIYKVHFGLAHSPLHVLWCHFKSFSWRYLYGSTKTWRYTKRGKLSWQSFWLYNCDINVLLVLLLLFLFLICWSLLTIAVNTIHVQLPGVLLCYSYITIGYFTPGTYVEAREVACMSITDC